MAVAEVTSANATSATQSSFTISITVSGTNPVLIVKTVLNSATATVSSVTWSLGSGTTTEVKALRGSNGVLSSIWVVPAPSAGAGTITVNLSASVPSGGTATVFSGTDQVSPCPTADAVTSTSIGASTVLTPGNLSANDASDCLGANITSGNWSSATPNQRVINNTNDPGYIGGDATGTTGVTLNNDGGMTAGSIAMVAIRIQVPTSASNQLMWVKG
jgi:hypothetical protein